MAIYLADTEPRSDADDAESGDSRRRRDPEATRRAILDAARDLFVCHGPAATSLSSIARKADVTKSLIHHHFGSKEELWAEVQARHFEKYFEIQQQMLVESESTEGLLRDSMIAYFRFLQENPDSVRFMTWSLLDGEDRPCPAQEKELFELGIERIREAQEKGDLRDDLEPFFIIKSLLALPMGWFQTREITHQLVDSEIDAGELDELYLDDMVRHFFEGVRPRKTPDADADADADAD